MRDRIDRGVKALRHPLRLVVVLMAVSSVVMPFASGVEVVAALLGGVVGVVLGEVLGRAERVRAQVVLGGLVLTVVVALLLSRLVVAVPLVARIVGPGAALHLRTSLVLGALAFGALASLRAVAVRRPALRFAELGVYAVGFVAAFAAHREGSIARPLWLSDWAWRAGHDPGNVLMAIAAVFGVLCAGLLLMESKQRLSAITLASLPVIAVVFLSVVDPRELRPDDAAEALEQLQTALPSAEGQEIEQLIPVTYGHGDPALPTGPGALDGPVPGEGNGGGETDGTAPEDPQPGDAAQGDGQADAGDGEGLAPPPGDDAGGEGQGQGDPADAGGEGQGQGDPADASGEGQGDPSDATGESQDPSEAQDGERQGPPPDKPPPSDQADMEFEGGRQSGGGPSPAAVVVFLDDYRTPSGYYYFRQEVFSAFGGSRMLVTTRDDADLDVMHHFPTAVEVVGDVPPWQTRKRVRGRVALLGEHELPFALESAALYLPSSNPNPDRFTQVYRFESYAQETPYKDLVGRYAGDPAWSAELRDYYLTAPADPRYQALVDQILGELPEDALDDPFTRALAIKVYLDAHMKYSITRRYPSAADPTAEFLFDPSDGDDMVGFCVHAAHAAVYLWRLAGVPARVGTGYLVDESARRGSALMVMGTDAHAWPELYLDGVGWVPMDITASEDLDPAGSAVDSDMTGIMGEMLRDAEDVAQPEPTPRRFALWLRRIVFFSVLGVTLTLLLGHAAVKAWRRAAPYLVGGTGVPRTAYRAGLDRLAELGHRRAEGETREAFAARLRDVAPALEKMTALHVAAALGDPQDRSGPTWSPVVWRDVLADLDLELRHAAPWWRRTLGLLDPTSLYRAR